MNWMTGFLTYPSYVLGFIWALCMSMRLWTLGYEVRIMVAAFAAMRYPANPAGLIFRRFIVPSILAAPAGLWMQGRDFFRRESASTIFDHAMELRQAYGLSMPEDAQPKPVEPGLPSVDVRTQRPAPPPRHGDRPKYGATPMTRLLNGED